MCVGKGVEKGGGYGSEVLPGRRVAWIEVHVSRHHNKYGFPFRSSPTMHITSAYVRIVHPTHLHIRTLYPGHLGDLQNEDEDRKYICSVTHVSRDFQ